MSMALRKTGDVSLLAGWQKQNTHELHSRVICEVQKAIMSSLTDIQENETNLFLGVEGDFPDLPKC